LVEVAFTEIELAEARSTQDRRQLNSQFPQLSATSTIVRTSTKCSSISRQERYDRRLDVLVNEARAPRAREKGASEPQRGRIIGGAKSKLIATGALYWLSSGKSLGRAGPAATDGKQRYWRCRH
jgi:hypothetical protein